MSSHSKSKTFKYCITVNSLVYFLIAYYFVVFSYNLFSMMLGKVLGFESELFYYGFKNTGKAWTSSDVILVFFVGNALTLIIAILFERLYKKQRKYSKGIKMLFLWIYLISVIWFLGNIIIGAFFNFGIGAAVRAYKIPFFLRLVFALISIYLLLFLGWKAQKHVRISANLYYPRLLRIDTQKFLFFQIVLPSLLGIIIIMLLKIPHLTMYHFVDIYLLLTIVFFLAGLFYKNKSHGSMVFKAYDSDKLRLNRRICRIAFFPLFIAIIILAIIRIGLMNGVAL